MNKDIERYLPFPRIRKQVVETCRRIVQENLGFVWLQ